MRIRRLLLIAFLLLLFLTAAPLMALAFFASRSALEMEIARNLERDATMLMAQVDTMMFERLQNIHSWSHLDILQEARIGDVDKRLAQFLMELGSSYRGIYRNLYYLDRQNRVVAASRPETIGSIQPAPANWLQTLVPNGEAFLEPLHLQPPYNHAELLIRAPVHDLYAAGDIGQLYGAFDMDNIFRLFDQASHNASGDRFVVLLDAQGRTIAASAKVREQNLLLGNDFSDWLPISGQDRLFLHDGAPLGPSQMLVGLAVSNGQDGFSKLGWKLLVMQSTRQAFQPVWSLWWLFAGVCFGITALAVGGALWVAASISKPLVSLTTWARQFRFAGYASAPLNVAGAQEVRELGQAFGQLLEDLESSRRQVEHAAKLAVVGELTAVMAHEVRTPLSIMHTSAQMLALESGLSAEGRELAQFVLEEGKRLDKLVSTLLECAKPRAAQMGLHDLHGILRRAVDLLALHAKKKRVALSLEFLIEDALIECDSELLMQVFLNLLLNAIQHAPAEGRVRLATWAGNSHLYVCVEDDGSGISPENQLKLFDPFFTTREGGVGLGLTVAQQIVAAHQGHIDVAPSAWGGARFVLQLPFRQGVGA